jgi:hypothetical protein
MTDRVRATEQRLFPTFFQRIAESLYGMYLPSKSELSINGHQVSVKFECMEKQREHVASRRYGHESVPMVPRLLVRATHKRTESLQEVTTWSSTWNRLMLC